MADTKSDEQPWGYIQLRLERKRYEEVKRAAKKRSQTMCGYLMELHRCEVARVAAERASRGIYGSKSDRPQMPN